MSQNNLIKFCQLAKTDLTVSKRLQCLSKESTNSAIDDIMRIAEEQGLPFTRDDYFDYLIAMQMNKLNG